MEESVGVTFNHTPMLRFGLLLARSASFQLLLLSMLLHLITRTIESLRRREMDFLMGLEGIRDSALRVVLQTKNSRHNDTAEHYKSFV